MKIEFDNAIEDNEGLIILIPTIAIMWRKDEWAIGITWLSFIMVAIFKRKIKTRRERKK